MNLKAVAIQHMARCLFRWSDCRQLRLRVRNKQPLRSRRLCGPRLVLVQVTSILTCVPVGLCSLPYRAERRSRCQCQEQVRCPSSHQKTSQVCSYGSSASSSARLNTRKVGINLCMFQFEWVLHGELKGYRDVPTSLTCALNAKVYP